MNSKGTLNKKIKQYIGDNKAAIRTYMTKKTEKFYCAHVVRITEKSLVRK